LQPTKNQSKIQLPAKDIHPRIRQNHHLTPFVFTVPHHDSVAKNEQGKQFRSFQEEMLMKFYFSRVLQMAT